MRCGASTRDNLRLGKRLHDPHMCSPYGARHPLRAARGQIPTGPILRTTRHGDGGAITTAIQTIGAPGFLEDNGFHHQYPATGKHES